MKVRISVSLDEDTNQKLKELAAKNHTNVSQWVTNKVWEAAAQEEKAAKRARL